MKEKQEGVIEENRHNQVKMLASKIGVRAERWLIQKTSSPASTKTRVRIPSTRKRPGICGTSVTLLLGAWNDREANP